MIESSDFYRLGNIYESVGLGPNGESSVGLGAPVPTQIEVEDEQTGKRIVGKVVTWRNKAWLVIAQQGANVKLVMLTEPEVIAPIKDVNVAKTQPK